MTKGEVPKWSPRFSAGMGGQAVLLGSKTQNTRGKMVFTYIYSFFIDAGMSTRFSHVYQADLTLQPCWCNFSHL